MESCPKCRGRFVPVLHPLTRDSIDLMCPACLTRPGRFYIDARGIGPRNHKIGRLFRDRQGRVFDSFAATHRELETIRHSIDDRTFDHTLWAPEHLKQRTVEREWERWVSTLYADGKWSSAQSAKYLGKNHVIPYMGKEDARDVRAHHIEAFYRWMQERIQEAGSVRSHLKRLQTFFRNLVRLEVIPKAPAFPSVKVERKDRTYIDRETQEAVIAMIHHRAQPLFRLMMETGCRPAEACSVRKKDLVDGLVILQRSMDYRGTMRETKAGQVFRKVVSARLYAELEAAGRGRFPDDLLFHSRQGGPYRTPRLSTLWKEAADKVGSGIPNLYVAMRHSRISMERDRVEDELRGRVLGILENGPEVARVHYLQRDRVSNVSEAPSK